MNYTLSVDKKERKNVSTFNDMEVGDIAYLPAYETYVLKTYENIVSLDNPENTWGTGSDLEVTPLPRGTKITLTAK